MNWQDHITSDPEVLQGKPPVRGTRLAVDFLIGLFAAEALHDQAVYPLPPASP